MGRLKIKKKESVLAFRETVAYRMFLLAGSIIAFLIALYIMIGALQAGNTVSLIATAIVSVAAAFAVFFNLERLRHAKIPQQTLKRMKRR